MSCHYKERLGKYAFVKFLQRTDGNAFTHDDRKKKKKSLWPPPNAFATVWHISQLLASILQAIWSYVMHRYNSNATPEEEAAADIPLMSQFVGKLNHHQGNVVKVFLIFFLGVGAEGADGGWGVLFPSVAATI